LAERSNDEAATIALPDAALSLALLPSMLPVQDAVAAGKKRQKVFRRGFGATEPRLQGQKAPKKGRAHSWDGRNWISGKTTAKKWPRVD
jgi:hypothetical protein